MADISQIGISSLAAFRAALNVSADNIANANTPGYSRRMIDFTENRFGYGVDVAAVRRVVDEQANAYARSSNSNFNSIDTYLKQLQQLMPIVEGDAGGVKKSINESLITLNSLTQNTASDSNRSVYLQKLNIVATQFHSLGAEFSRQLDDNTKSMSQLVTQINSILTNLAKTNSDLQSGSVGNPDVLADNRDTLLSELSQYIDFDSKVDSMGVVTLTLPNGAPILRVLEASKLKIIDDPSQMGNLKIGLVDGTSTSDVTSAITAGKMNGLIKYQQDIFAAQRALNRISLSFSNELNLQNKKGLDLYGAMGRNLFNDINGTIEMGQRVIAFNTNTGTGDMSVKVDDVNQLTTSDYRLVFGSAGAYTLTRLSDNFVQTGTLSGTFPQSISLDGFTINLATGTYNTSDQYTISPTSQAANTIALTTNDPKKLALAWPVAVQPLSTNIGKVEQVLITDITDPANASFSTAGQLSPPIRIVFTTPTSYDLINATTNVAIESGITYDPNSGMKVFPTTGSYDPGYRVSLSGTFSTGDTYTLGFNTKFSGSNDNAIALAKLYEKSVLQNGTLTFAQGYDDLTTEMATKANLATRAAKQASDIKMDADYKREIISGVTLEDETLNLSQYQQAYQASAQILTTAKNIFDMLINIIGR